MDQGGRRNGVGGWGGGSHKISLATFWGKQGCVGERRRSLDAEGCAGLLDAV